jgi:hypothetical protein
MALEKERVHRYSTAGALAADLRAIVLGEPILARRPGWRRRAREAARRHPAAVAAVAALAVGVPLALRIYQGSIDPSPRLHVVTEPPGAELAATRIDPADGSLGEARPLGTSPHDRRLPAGYYRVTASLEGVGWAEATRHLPEHGEVRVSLRILPTGPVTEAMALVSLDDPALLDRVRAAFAGAAPAAAYWIDRTEVSNGEFRRFLEETRSTFRPGLWGPAGSWDPAWDALPVSGVPYEQAQAYAEWSGKRLPTRAEWDLAARGPDAALYPWGGAEKLPAERLREWANVFRDDHDWIWSGEERFPELGPRYRGAVLPVSTLPEGSRDLSWAGLYHTLGNVAEWTESVPHDGEPDFGSRIVKGDLWGRDVAERWSLGSHMTSRVDHGAMLGCGFRCAKTVLFDAPAPAVAPSPTGRR